MLQDNVQSFPRPSNPTKQRSTRHQNSPKPLMDQQSNEVISRVKVKSSSLVTCINDFSISVLTTDICVNKCLVESSNPSVKIVTLKENKRKEYINKQFS